MSQPPVQALADSPRDERGDTLVEILIAVVVIGLAVTAMLGALLTTTTASVDHRSTATIDAALASFAQAAQHAVELDAFNGSGTGPSFTSACPANYQIIGSPIPARGPVGTQVAVLGTPSSLSHLDSATFDGAADPASVTSGSSSSGAIALMTVPTEPAGTYQLAPFDGTSLAASGFTVTPSLDSIGPAGGATGPGTTVDVGVHGFKAGASLTVAIGSTPVPVASGNPIAANGSGTIAFTIPNPLPAGDPAAQYLTVSDGTNTADPVLLSFASDTAPPTPVAATSPFDDGYYSFTYSVQYWNSGAWTSTCPGTNPNLQQLTFNLVDSQPDSGAGGVTTVVVGNLTAQTSPVPAPNLTAVAPPGSTGELDLTWNPPTYVGSSSITGYRLYRNASDTMPPSPFATVGVSPTSYSDTGLMTGNRYYYWIETVTSSGSSQPSLSAQGTTLPGPPAGLTATRGDGQETLSWDAPSPNGDAPVLNYSIFRNTTDSQPASPVATVGSAQTSYTDTGLTNGTTYYYWVSAANAGGEGGAAATSAVPGAPPSAPSNLVVGPNNTSTQLVLNWSAPTATGGLPVTYDLYRSTTSPTQPPSPYKTGLTGTTYTDQNLTSGSTYWYWMTAVNSIGEGAPTGPASYQAGAPGIPQNLTANGSCNRKKGKSCQNVLNWAAPTGDGGSKIGSYNVYISTTSSMPTIPAASVSTTSYTDSAVTSGTTYYYWVTAVNGSYEGAPSGPASATP